MSAETIKSKVAKIISKNRPSEQGAEGATSMATEEPERAPAIESTSLNENKYSDDDRVDSPVHNAFIGNEPGKLQKKRSSKYTGVCFSEKSKKWITQIKHDMTNISLSCYTFEAEAALAYDEGSMLLKGPDAKKNFASLEEYEDAKKCELVSNGFDAVLPTSTSAIKTKVAQMISHHLSKHGAKVSTLLMTNELGRTPANQSKCPSITKHLDDENTNKAASNSNIGNTIIGCKSSKLRNGRTSVYIGVSYYKATKKWRVYIVRDKKGINLGYYRLEADGALSYDEAAIQLKGPGARRNFASLKEYEDAKKHELINTGLDIGVAMSAETIKSKVAKIISKNRPSEQGAEGATSMATEEPERAPAIESTSLNENKYSDDDRVDSPVHNTFIGNEPGLQKESSSKYIGVCSYKRATKKWVANISFHGKQHFVGYWQLETDAAIAYDQASIFLRGDQGKVNFASRRAYKDSRAEELKKCDIDVETWPTIATKIQKHLSTIPCPEIDAINEAMCKKWASYLPLEETGKEYLETYQRKIDEMFGLTKLQTSECAASAPSVVSISGGGKKDGSGVEVELVQGKNMDFNPIKDSGPKNASPNNQRGDNNSDDDASLFSSAEEIEDLPAKDPAANPQPLDVNDERPFVHNNEPMAMSVNERNDTETPTNRRKETVKITHFPIGCPVMWDFGGDSFRSGMVTGVVPNTDALYEVTPTESSGQMKLSTVIAGKGLAFGLNCPVYVSLPCCHDEQLQGKILLCTPSSANDSMAATLLYTVLVPKEGNQIQVMRDVPSEHVIYRASAHDTIGNWDIHDSKPSSQQSQEKQSSVFRLATENKASPHTAATENKSQTSSQHFFSSNSTIDTEDSAAASSRRGPQR